MPERKATPRHHPQLARALGFVGRAVEALEGKRRILVALSGGPDSVALLGLLARLARREGLELASGHVDHALRPESADEARAAASVARELGIPHAQRRLDLQEGPGLPDRARSARYAALEAMREELGCEVLALGHTATDQLETVLMHLTRGCGLAGLAAMPVLRNGRWRPVLDLTREETRELCGLLGLNFVEDPTNQLREHLRVRVRHEVLPLLREQNPQVESAALALTRRLRDADAVVDAVVDAEFDARQRTEMDGQTLDLAGYAVLNRELRTRLILRVLRRSEDEPADGLRRIVEDVDRALCADARAGRGFAPRRWDAGGGRELWVARGRLGVDTPPEGAK